MSSSPLGSRTSAQRITGGLPGWYQRAVCEASSSVRMVPSYQDTDAVSQSSFVKALLEGGLTCPLDPRATGLARLTGWRGIVETGIPQPGDEGYGFMEGLAELEQVQDGIAIVGAASGAAAGWRG